MSSSIAADNFARWEQALLTCKPKTVAALYADNATLIPTMAQKVQTDHAGIVEYFDFFLSFHPRVSIIEEHVIEISKESYLHCGIYRFALTMQGVEQMVDARFSMLWQKVDGAWKILHHHSSRVPLPQK